MAVIMTKKVDLSSDQRTFIQKLISLSLCTDANHWLAFFILFQFCSNGLLLSRLFTFCRFTFCFTLNIHIFLSSIIFTRLMLFLHFLHQTRFISRRQKSSLSCEIRRLHSSTVFILVQYCLYR